MISFLQYILEVATEVPKNPRFHHDSHSTSKDDNTSSHQYDYKDHDQFVHFNHAHKEPHDHGLIGKHHSYISFVVDTETHRTGRQRSLADPTGVRGASEKLSNVSHAIGHHIDKVVEPNMKHHGEHYFSYHASKDHDDSGINPEAREQTYHKMAKRLMKRHGYKHHATLKEKDSGGNLRYIYKKKGKKK